MQLMSQLKHKPTHNITRRLAQATSLLLVAQATQAANNPMLNEVDSTTATTDHVAQVDNTSSFHRFFSPGWKVDTALLKYDEENRVSTLEPIIIASKDFGDEHIFNNKLVLDALTGASPNGQLQKALTTATTTAQTCTNASGKVVTCGSNTSTTTPTVVTEFFEDKRIAYNAGWSQPLAQDKKMSIGTNISKESDFLSTGLNAALSKDINNKNTTLSAGLSGEFDQINPKGGAPVGMTLTGAQQRQGNQTKHVADALLGITQVLNRRSLIQFNYAYSNSSGYLTDPYKVLTTLSTSYNLVSGGLLFESRPDSRVRHSLFSQFKYNLNAGDVLDVSYRYTTDDWGTKTNTFDAKYRLDFEDSFYIEPHARYYQQTAANFYKPYLLQNTDVTVTSTTITPKASLPYASADTRLAAFEAATLGLKIGYALDKDSEISFRVEQYQQTMKNQPVLLTGDLKGAAVAPELKVLFMQAGYSFKW